jgi:hypothetical protein
MFDEIKLYYKAEQVRLTKERNLRKKARQADYLEYYAYKRGLTAARKARRTEERDQSGPLDAI